MKISKRVLMTVAFIGFSSSVEAMLNDDWKENFAKNNSHISLFLKGPCRERERERECERERRWELFYFKLDPIGIHSNPIIRQRVIKGIEEALKGQFQALPSTEDIKTLYGTDKPKLKATYLNICPSDQVRFLDRLRYVSFLDDRGYDFLKFVMTGHQDPLEAGPLGQALKEMRKIAQKDVQDAIEESFRYVDIPLHEMTEKFIQSLSDRWISTYKDVIGGYLYKGPSPYYPSTVYNYTELNRIVKEHFVELDEAKMENVGRYFSEMEALKKVILKGLDPENLDPILLKKILEIPQITISYGSSFYHVSDKMTWGSRLVKVPDSNPKILEKERPHIAKAQRLFIADSFRKKFERWRQEGLYQKAFIVAESCKKVGGEFGYSEIGTAWLGQLKGNVKDKIEELTIHMVSPFVTPAKKAETQAKIRELIGIFSEPSTKDALTRYCDEVEARVTNPGTPPVADVISYYQNITQRVLDLQ